MIVGSIARRYARALLEIGVAAKNLEALGRELESVAGTLAKSDELRVALENPVFPLSQRRAVLDEVLKRLAISQVMRNFLMLVLDRGRIAEVGAIAREFRALVDEQAGRVRAVLTSARPLWPLVEKRIKSALEAKTGKIVLVEKREDPTLLGGVVAQIGDLVFDGSLRTQLANVRQQLLSE